MTLEQLAREKRERARTEFLALQDLSDLDAIRYGHVGSPGVPDDLLLHVVSESEDLRDFGDRMFALVVNAATAELGGCPVEMLVIEQP